MVGRHVGDGLRAQDAPAIERAAVEQHLAEARVVHDRADHAAAARLPALRRARVEELGVGADRTIVGERLGDTPLARLVGHVERRVLHAERVEDPLLLELVERLLRDDLHDAAEHVGRVAVVPHRARVIGERQLDEPLHELGVRRIAVEQLRLEVLLLHQRAAEDAVRHPGGVAQEVLDGHLSPRRHQLERRVAVGARLLDADPHLGDLRDVLPHGIAERELALLDEDHRRDRRDRLAHRVDAEDRVLRHRRLRRRIQHAHALEQRDPALPRDQEDGAGDLALLRVVAQRRHDAAQPLGRQAHLLGLDARQGLGVHEGDGGQPQQRRQQRDLPLHRCPLPVLGLTSARSSRRGDRSSDAA